MVEMARGYCGPHQVRVRRSSKNFGVLKHVLSVARDAHGEIFVVAAGDDVSESIRTAVIVEQLVSSNHSAISSDDTIIDEGGTERVWDENRLKQRKIWHQENSSWLHGATSAYRSRFLQSLPIIETPVFYEDQVFSDIMQALGMTTGRIEEPLVKYRYHLQNLSNRISEDTSHQAVELQSIIRWYRASEAKRYSFEYLKNDAKNASEHRLRKLKLEYQYLRELSHWQDSGLTGKIRLVYYSIKSGNFRSFVPRVFGKQFFLKAKRLQRLLQKSKT